MKQKRKVILISALCVLLFLAAFTVYGNIAARRDKASAQAETVKVERMNLSQNLTLSGTVESGASYSVTSTLADVEVKSVNVKVGDRVNKGDIIAVLDDSQLSDNYNSAQRSLGYTEKKNRLDISAAERSLDNSVEDRDIQQSRGAGNVRDAKSQYNKASAELSALKKRLSSAKADTEKKKKLLDKASQNAAPAKTKLPAKEAELSSALGDVQSAEKKLEELKAAGAGSTEIAAAQRAYDDSLSKLNAVQTQYDSLKSLIDAEQQAETNLQTARNYETDLQSQIKSAEGTVTEQKSAVKKAEEDRDDANRSSSRNVDEQKGALRSAKLSARESKETSQNEVNKAGREMDKSIVRAQAGGIITSLNVKPGDIYKGDSIAVINDEDGYRISASADQYDISSLAIGQKADITVAPAEMEEAAGRLIHVARTPKVTETENGGSKTSTDYLVEATIENPNTKLRIGMTAKVVVKVWEKKDVLAVPDNCVQTDENGNKYVTLMDEKGSTKNVNVKYGMRTDYYSEIEGTGIKEGVTVVVPEADTMDDADKEADAS